MDMTEWIRNGYKTHGRAWLHANFETMCMELNITGNSESYMRCIRRVCRENGTPTNIEDVLTVEDSMDFHNLDMTQFQVKNVKVNTWGSPSNPNKQVKMELTPRFPEVDLASIIDDFKTELATYKPIQYKAKKRSTTGSRMLEINIPDAHFGLLAWARETGDTDYDINIARDSYLEAADALLTFGKDSGLRRIVLVVGSDFFNSDSLDNTTTKGTKQSEDSRFQKSFQIGWHTIRDTIDMCAEIADVEVVVIPGNHDFQKSFYLGEVLSAWYSENAHVHIDNQPTYFKYKAFGTNLIGYSHGDTVKAADLPLLMATDVPALWSITKNREWHIGHHHMSTSIEKPGCKVISVPSIAPASDWIAKMGYRSQREAQAFLYDETKGRIANYNYRPQE